MEHKICVYAICKNEEKFIERWYNSIKDADYICVLDTGSTDNSVNLLKKLGIKVKCKKYKNFRFDVARNDSLKIIPKNVDICVCMDIDEVIISNWKNIILNNWKENTTRLSYTYNWLLDENNKPKICFYCNKIHKNNYYEWINPVHEVLKLKEKYTEKQILIDNLIINHYQDTNKERKSYLPLLELSIKENPNNDRNMHYLGREYMYYKKYNKAIDILIKHLALPNSTWKDERCASMRFIARCYKMLKRYEESELWYKKSIKEAPYLRDGYIELAILYYELNKWSKLQYYIFKALKITGNPKTYINEYFTYNETPYDLLSIAFFYQKKYKASLKYINIALTINNNNERLINNKKLIEKFQ